MRAEVFSSKLLATRAGADHPKSPDRVGGHGVQGPYHGVKGPKN